MIDSFQLLLAVVIGALSIILTIIGLAIFQILKELKKSVEKINLILDDTHRMSSAVAQPVEDASEFIHGIKGGMQFFKALGRYFRDEKDKRKSKFTNQADEDYDYEDEDVEKEPKKKKRFFKRNGKILK